MRVMIVAGGTGGHLYPGIALARSLTAHEVLFIVRRGDLGRDILQKEGIAVQEIEGQGLPRSLSLRWFTFPFKFIKGWGEARNALQQFKPDRVVGMGGYLSFSVILNAHFMGIRTMLHEQNVYPGLANRLLSWWADSVAVSFPTSLGSFNGRKVWISGLPVRPEIGEANAVSARHDLGLTDGSPVILIFGGSLGAKRLNTLTTEAFAELSKRNHRFQIFHIAGPKEFDRVAALYKDYGLSATVVPYCHDMSKAYAAADAVVCRAGASTIAELSVVQRPALLIPYPYASNNHQLHNAQLIAKTGQAKVVLEKDLTPEAIAEFLTHLPVLRQVPVANEIDPRLAAGRLAHHLNLL